ncbi:hypothetical protein [Eisenibacter elegans]|uniref:hypothetical protein n=1 Tax=Eisenibacter elegans TaxID=997 RepID=UPI0004177E4F|nr:hypothetical protein [Eisenibacter elegans]
MFWGAAQFGQPFIAFFSWFLFRREGLNYAEHWVFNAYMSSQTAILGILRLPLYLWNLSVATWAGLAGKAVTRYTSHRAVLCVIFCVDNVDDD